MYLSWDEEVNIYVVIVVGLWCKFASNLFGNSYIDIYII